MAILTGTLWNAKSATIGGDWILDAWGGLLRGVIYIDRKALATRNPATVTATLSDGTTKETENPNFTIGDTVVTRLPFSSTAQIVPFQIDTPGASEESRGLWQVDALYTTADKTLGDYYTKEEVDTKVSNGVREAEQFAQRECAAVEDKVTGLDGEIKKLTTTSGNMGNAINSLTNRVSTLETTMGQVASSLEALEASALKVVGQGHNANGYWVQFSNGAMKQWGKGKTVSTGNITQSFPTAFPGVPGAIFAVQGYMTDSNVGTTGACRIDDSRTTVSSFQLQLRDVISGGTVKGNSSSFFWFAEYWPNRTFSLEV